MITKIAEMVERGMAASEACRALGVHPDNYYKWMRGEIPQSVLEECDTPEKKLAKRNEFRERIEEAKANFLNNALKNLHQLGEGIKDEKGNYVVKPNWIVWAWLLERTYPQYFSLHKFDQQEQLQQGRRESIGAGEGDSMAYEDMSEELKEKMRQEALNKLKRADDIIDEPE